MSVATASVLGFILHIPYVVDACALPSILSSLYLTDTMYCTREVKPTPASASTFRLICSSLLRIVLKHDGNRTARFRCAFCSTDVPLNVRRICAYDSAHTFSHLNYMNLLAYYFIRGCVLQGLGEFRLG
jgi:hypothetical protein